jgi:hypothetical protein
MIVICAVDAHHVVLVTVRKMQMKTFLNRYNPFPLAVWLAFVVWFAAGYVIGGALQAIYSLKEASRGINYDVQYRDIFSERNDQK